VNYQSETDSIIASLGGKTPRLLLHACCAPCASYVLEYLSEYFDITIFYYNPNIYPADEHEKRLSELKKLVTLVETKNPVSLIEREYEPSPFYESSRGLESEPEGGIRCNSCFSLRLEEAAKTASAGSFDYFTTTLTVGPRKNAELINQIGKALSEKYAVPYLYSDFKKRGGYQRSIELCKKYGIYRQHYCGCGFSLEG
jgi:predicted adenine nucleotide alpha hydrolase (AANH) superfamily ATPase